MWLPQGDAVTQILRASWSDALRMTTAKGDDKVESE